MGFRKIQLNVPTEFGPGQIRKQISKKLHIKSFSYTIEKQSLDARNKRQIHWTLQVGVHSPSLPGPDAEPKPVLQIPYKKRDKRIVVVGSGPAGFFSAYVLVLAGFHVTLLEQGAEVGNRFKNILDFERTGILDERSNYAFGEGGAGTFSDGKLTSRTKTISLEKDFIFNTYIEAGAPKEIAWLSHPHLGSDNLRKVIKILRRTFKEKGGTFLFDTKVSSIFTKQTKDGTKIVKVETDKGQMEADYFIFATGHSSYDTYRMLIRKGVAFQTKGFALGSRVEHPQELINRAQWDCPSLPGVKAAEYRLTYKPQDGLPVYSFCMCPGGKVVPASAFKKTIVVNGMSNYHRNAPYANAAIVAAVHPDQLAGKKTSPLEALEKVLELEESFYSVFNSYKAPACRIEDFLANRVSATLGETSYPFGIQEADLNHLLPPTVSEALKKGLEHFTRKLKGFESGVLLGLESKTSAPIQAKRDKSGKSDTIDNLYISGEGSGFAGGIISSAADGIKAAMDIIGRE